MRQRWLHMALALLPLGCGPVEESEAVHVVVPWHSALACPERTQLGAKLQATLKIGGHKDCPLEVDPTTLSASGTCDAVTTRTVRPLLLVYAYDDRPALSSVLPVAFWISYVNLCEENLPSGSNPEVSVDFSSADAELLTTPEQLASLPPDANQRPSCSDGLNEARQWAKTQIEEMGANLDSDSDLLSNLHEICNGTPP